jgi:hypothetical protein
MNFSKLKCDRRIIQVDADELAKGKRNQKRLILIHVEGRKRERRNSEKNSVA